jgi:hypothetical protein
VQQFAHNRKNILQRNVVNLKFLSRRNVNRRIAIPCGYLGKRPQLTRSKGSAGPNPYHVCAIGALLIAAKRNTARLQRGSVKLALR